MSKRESSALTLERSERQFGRVTADEPPEICTQSHTLKNMDVNFPGMYEGATTCFSSYLSYMQSVALAFHEIND